MVLRPAHTLYERARAADYLSTALRLRKRVGGQRGAVTGGGAPRDFGLSCSPAWPLAAATSASSSPSITAQSASRSGFAPARAAGPERGRRRAVGALEIWIVRRSASGRVPARGCGPLATRLGLVCHGRLDRAQPARLAHGSVVAFCPPHAGRSVCHGSLSSPTELADGLALKELHYTADWRRFAPGLAAKLVPPCLDLMDETSATSALAMVASGVDDFVSPGHESSESARREALQ